MISFGITETGLNMISPINLRGIFVTGATSNIYFNSIYIGGSGVGVSSSSTNCYEKSGSVTTDVRNNIFHNNRSNATTGGTHYSAVLNSSAATKMDYNVYFGTGTVYNVSALGVTDFTTLINNWIPGDANSISLDPVFMNPNGNASNV